MSEVKQWSLKISRNWFIFLMTVINAANALLVPQIPIPYLSAFTAVVLNATVVLISSEQRSSSEDE